MLIAARARASTAALVALAACGRTAAAPPRDAATPSRDAVAARDAATPREATIGVPGRVEGALETGDRVLLDGSLGDDYAVVLTAGRPVTIVTRGGPSVTRPGTPVDVFTVLSRGGLEVAHDDDSAFDGGALNSRIVFTPTESGRYVIRVSTYGRGVVRGAYTLETWDGARPDQS